jgi:hypothetical protein
MRTIFGIISLSSIALLIICSQCEHAMDYAYEIDLVNNSGHPIGYYFAVGGKYGTFYPDSLPEANDYIIYDITKVLQPGFEQHYKSWEKFFHELPYDTLSVFIFHTDTLNKYTWEEVRDGYKILRRYDLSLEDIDEMDYTIIYP